ncbi:MAG: AAA family ATPase [Deltaproteobacteria bacterium]
MSVRIERLSIRDFGPLRDLVLVPDDVTVVYGQNEAGKTSCIDALVHALRDRVRDGHSKLLDQTRDGPGFEGEIELILTPEDGGTVVELLREHPSLARLFIVRDADPSLEGGRTWLNAIRGRLIGIDLVQVGDALRRQAGLMPSGSPREAREDERQRLTERLARIEGFIADLPGIGRLLEEVHQLSVQRLLARTRAEKLRAAERFERYRTADHAAGAVREAGRRLLELERYGDADLREWHEAIRTLREAAAIAKTAENESARLQTDLMLAREEAKKRAIANDKSRTLVGETQRSELAPNLEEAKIATAAARSWSIWRTPLGIAAFVLILLALGLVFQATSGVGALAMPLGIGAGAAATFALLCGALSITAQSRMRKASTATEELLARARTLLGPLESLADCAAQLQLAAGMLERNEAEYGAAKRAVGVIEDHLASAGGVEKDRNQRLGEVQRQIAEIRDRVHLSRIEQLEDKTRDRATTQASLTESRRTLSSLLGEVDENRPLEDQVAALTIDDPGVAPNPVELASLEHELEGYDERLGALRARLTDQREHALARIGIGDLGKADAERNRLQQAIAAMDRDTAGAKLALQALRELASDIDQPLREALGSGPMAAGRYLAKLTGGRYCAVILDADGGLAVERDDGSRLPAEALSRGARDQLALAVRLALVRRLLGEPGFLVLDDAFLTSDAARREALAVAIADLASEGWQILYFTFDPALRDRLAQLNAKVIELPPPTRLAAAPAARRDD